MVICIKSTAGSYLKILDKNRNMVKNLLQIKYKYGSLSEW